MAKLEQRRYNERVAQTSVWKSRNGKEVQGELSFREFVAAVMVSVTAHYLIKCLDALITLIFG